jgi:hypothetical protein
LGLLFSSGWTLDDALDLTWEQLTICIKCVIATKADQMSMIMDAVSIALGGKGSKKKSKTKSKKTKDKAEKEQYMMDKLSAMGVSVEQQGGSKAINELK